MDFSQLSQLIPQPGGIWRMQECIDLIPSLVDLGTTPQDPIYHAEGDVLIHTTMVIDAMVNSQEYATASEADRFVLFVACLLHDISKPATTQIDPISGRISQPGHSRRGAVDSRILLWRAGVPFELREKICRIINVHQVPFYAMGDNRRGDAPEFTLAKLSWEIPIWMLCAVAKADMIGRICQDQQRILDDVELFRLFAEEKGALSTPLHFADPYTRQRYFAGANVQPDYALFRERQGSQVIVMCGMPATGKDTWVRVNHPNLPVVSFDDARTELGLAHGKNEGLAAHRATDKAKELLRAGEPFVWNATHLSLQMRTKTLDLLHAYHADVRVVYLEQPEKVVMSRNSKRDTSLKNESITKMLHRWEVPVPHEASVVDYLVEAPQPLKGSARPAP